MKGVVGVAIVLALTAAAGAKPAPVGDLNRAIEPRPGPQRCRYRYRSRRTRASYFQAPQQHFNTGNVSCRLQLSVFDKTRLAHRAMIGVDRTEAAWNQAAIQSLLRGTPHWRSRRSD